MAWAVTEAGRARNRLVDRARAEAAGTGATFDERAHRRGLRRSPDGREAVRREVAAETARRRTIRIDATGGADNAAGQVRGKQVVADVATYGLLFRARQKASADLDYVPSFEDSIRYDYLRMALLGGWERINRSIHGKDENRVEVVGFKGEAPIFAADGNRYVANVEFKQSRNLGTGKITETRMVVNQLPDVTWGEYDCDIAIPDQYTQKFDFKPTEDKGGVQVFTGQTAEAYYNRFDNALTELYRAKNRLTSPQPKYQ